MKNPLYLIIFLLLLTGFDSLFAQAPSISYTGPNNYLVGTAITPLVPSNTGGAVPDGVGGSVSFFAPNLGPRFNNPQGVAVDPAGNVYVADTYNFNVDKISATGDVTVLAGSGTSGFANGTGTAASFGLPSGLAVDASDNVYVADQSNNMIRKITPAGVVTTLTSNFGGPAIALDAAGNLYGVEGNMVVKISATGVVTTLAGSSNLGTADGTGAAAGFATPFGLTVDASGNIYVADSGNNLIRKVTQAGVVTTLAVSGGPGFNFPTGVAVDTFGNIFVADHNNNEIREISPAGVVSTYAGSGAADYEDGIGINSAFDFPFTLAIDASNNLYVADYLNNIIRKIVTVGYYISPALPPGLAFDGATGTISGTPTATSPATNYMVTAYNPDASNVATVRIAVNINTAPPIISYPGSPLTFITGFPVTINPTNTGGVVSGYASIGPLPIGLSLDSTSGVISGIPTVVSTAANYSIRAFNSFGSDTTTINIQVNSNNPVRPPNITYTSPHIYTVGTPIAPLAPSNTGDPVPVSADGSVVTTLAGSLSFPVGVALDKSGNVYVGDEGDGLILKINPFGFVTTLAGNGNPSPGNPPFTVHYFFGPDGVAVDKFGNVYVDDSGDFAVKAVDPGGSISTLVSNIQAQAIAVDTSGNVFLAVGQSIEKVSPGGAITLIAGIGTIGAANGPAASASFFNPRGIAVDASGNVYVGDSDNNLIRKVSVAGVVTTLAGSGAAGSANGTGAAATFNSPRGLAVDGAGNVYVADYGNNQVRKISPSGVVTTLAGDGSAGYQDGIGEQAEFGNISYVAVDASGNVYAGDTENGAIRKIIPVGYSVSPALPAGLVLDAATGIISGTPTTVSPATSYTAVARNTGGSASATFSITVTSGALNIDSLHNLTISSGSLTPAFASNTTAYAVSVGNAVNSITVTPTAVNSAAAITVNGTPVMSGSASAGIPLSVGANTIATMVTSQDGTATMTYSIIVTRAPSANANLADLAISSGTLSPVFASTITNYTAIVTNTTTSVTIIPTAADSTAIITVNGVSTLSGSHAAGIPLSVGANTINVIVTAQDGTTTKTYSVIVTRTPPAVPDLANLTLSSGKLSPSFSRLAFNYTARVGRNISSITVTPTARVATFIITVNGTVVSSGSPSPAISLAPGVNTITIDVNTRDGIVTGVYTITVTREGGGTFANANILNLDNSESQTDSLQNVAIVVHQAVSPNGDGINDVLTIDNIGNYPDNKVTLIDMSGTAIYKIAGYDNVNRVFNGHSNITGALQQPGTYFYLLEYKTNGEFVRKTGFFILRY